MEQYANAHIHTFFFFFFFFFFVNVKLESTEILEITFFVNIF